MFSKFLRFLITFIYLQIILKFVNMVFDIGKDYRYARKNGSNTFNNKESNES